MSKQSIDIEYQLSSFNQTMLSIFQKLSHDTICLVEREKSSICFCTVNYRVQGSDLVLSRLFLLQVSPYFLKFHYVMNQFTVQGFISLPFLRFMAYIFGCNLLILQFPKRFTFSSYNMLIICRCIYLTGGYTRQREHNVVPLYGISKMKILLPILFCASSIF